MFSYDKQTKKIGFDMDADKLQQVISQFRQAVRAGQRGIKGTMNTEDINYAQTDLLLNLMMQFKTWMPGILNERFGKLKYNDVLDAPQWGRYSVLWHAINEKEYRESAKTLMYFLDAAKNGLMNFFRILYQYNTVSTMLGVKQTLNEQVNKIYLEEYKNRTGEERITLEQFMKMKKGQLRAVAAELEIVLAFTAAIVALGMDWDEDGEPLYKDNFMLTTLYRALNRARTEIAFTFNPNEYSKLIRSPLPLSSLAVQTANLVNNTMDEMGDLLFGEDTDRFPFPFGKNSHPDKTETLHYTWSLIPGAYQLRRTFGIGPYESLTR